MTPRSVWLPIALAIVASFLITATIAARDVYVVQGFANGVSFNRETTIWSTDALFYNTGSVDRHVVLLAISNGVDPTARVGQSLTVPPGKTASLQQQTRWVPAIPLVVLHLDVPDDVIMDNMLFIGSRNDDILSSPSTLYRRYGKIRLPIFDSLAPPNEAQVHLESDIGDIDAHVNVGIYNAGDRPAIAHVETRAICDDGVVVQQFVTVPPNSVLQIGPMQTDTRRCPAEQSRSIYTVVTVDQPSLTFVSALANSNVPTTSISITGN